MEPPDLTIYGSSAYGNLEMVAFDLDSSYEVVGSVFVPTQAIAQDPATGYVYYFEWTTGGDVLAYWNPATGGNTVVRNYSSAPGFYAKRMDFAPDGTLYLMDDHERLYTINKNTGAYSLVGTVTGMVTGSYGATGDMAFAPDGTMYIATYENLYRVNLPSLQATLIAQNMIDVNLPGEELWTGLGYCDGYLYATDAREATGLSSFYRINPNGGGTTLLYDTNLILNDLASCVP